MNVFQNIVNMYNLLPINSTYRAVLKAILMNLRDIEDTTIYEAAEITASSRTTIWRAVKQMGYKSYSDFIHALSKAVSQYSYYNRVDMGTASSDVNVCLDKIGEKLCNTLTAYKNIDVEYALNIVSMINAADRVAFYGFEGNPYIYAMQENLSMNGKETNLFLLYPDMLEDAKSTDENTFTFVHTLEYPETMDLEHVFSTLKKREGRIALEHTGPDSRYKKYADVFLGKIYKTPGRLDNVFTGVMTMAVLNELYRGQFMEI